MHMTRTAPTAALAALTMALALLLLGSAPAKATKVFDGTSWTERPATITGLNGYFKKSEISAAKLLIGGPDAEPGNYGEINWVKWSRNLAVGFGTGWHLGELSYDSQVGANPWIGGKVRVTLVRKKGRFLRLGVRQRTSWRTESEPGKCDYALSFVYKPVHHRVHPWMQIGIGGGWPMTKQPCFGIRVS